MREKIVEAIRCEIYCGYEGQLLDVGDGADKILALICEEIEKNGAIKSFWVNRDEKVEGEITRLTIPDMERAYSHKGNQGLIEKAGELAAQAQLQKILDLLSISPKE